MLRVQVIWAEPFDMTLKIRQHRLITTNSVTESLTVARPIKFAHGLVNPDSLTGAGRPLTIQIALCNTAREKQDNSNNNDSVEDLREHGDLESPRTQTGKFRGLRWAKK